MSDDKRWLNPSDPGILRNKPDILVFGYSCTLFRDDQKALEMDQGKHLIPWNGVESLKIDRYDARGLLSELSQFESASYDYVQTSKEKEFETRCDEERYRALEHNEEEHLLYQEEEFKRLQNVLSNKEYGQVSYQYTEDSQTTTTSSEATPAPNEDLEPFVPSPFLDIPQNMVLPKTKKENQIIEKTATYIAHHGPQVEIVVKTREAKNEKLGFMQSGNPLNPYYNFILDGIKHGRYRPGTEQQKKIEEDVSEDYLHPTLSSSAPVESAPSIPNITYKPSTGSSYDLLVKKIQQTNDIGTLLPSKRKSATALNINKQAKNIPKSNKMGSPKKPNIVKNKTILLPPSNIREIITKLINFSQTIGLHPSKLAPNLLKTDSKNMEFLLPDHPYHAFYQEQLVIFSKKDDKTKVTTQLQSSDATNVYDPENPTDDVESSTLNCTDISKNKVDEDSEEEITTGYDAWTTGHVSSEEPDNSQEERTSLASTNSPENSNHSLIRSLTPPIHQPTTSKYDVPNQPTQKLTPVCFSIKKPKEEKLEIPSALPFEETWSEDEDEENKEKEKEKVAKQKPVPPPILIEPPKTPRRPIQTVTSKRQTERKDKSHKSSHREKTKTSDSHKRSKTSMKSTPSKSNKTIEHSHKKESSSKSKHRSKKQPTNDSTTKSESKPLTNDPPTTIIDLDMPVTPPLQPALSPPPKEIDKVKKEERKKKAKVLVDRLKKEESNKKATVLLETFKSCLNDLVVETLEEPKNVEEHLRKKVKKSLQELAQKIADSPTSELKTSDETSHPYTRVELNADIHKKTNVTVKSVKLRHKRKKNRDRSISSDESSSSASSKTSSDSEDDSSSNSSDSSSSVNSSRKRKSSHRKHSKHSHRKRRKLSNHSKKVKSHHKHSKKSHRKHKRRNRSTSSS